MKQKAKTDNQSNISSVNWNEYQSMVASHEKFNKEVIEPMLAKYGIKTIK